MQRQEGCAETCAEDRLWFSDAGLGSCDFRGVAADEPVHGLAGRQPADRWKNAVRIASKEEDVLRMRSHAGHSDIIDVMDRVAYAGVLRLGTIGEIHMRGAFLEHDVLQQ